MIPQIKTLFAIVVFWTNGGDRERKMEDSTRSLRFHNFSRCKYVLIQHANKSLFSFDYYQNIFSRYVICFNQNISWDSGEPNNFEASSINMRSKNAFIKICWLHRQLHCIKSNNIIFFYALYNVRKSSTNFLHTAVELKNISKYFLLWAIIFWRLALKKSNDKNNHK